MNDRGSITLWISGAQQGDESALLRLHQRYWRQLVRMAQRRLGTSRLTGVDAEDIAQSAFWEMHLALQKGRHLDLSNRHQFLALLSRIVTCRAINEIERAAAKKRRGTGAAGSIVPSLATDATYRPLEKLIIAECYESFVNGLPVSLRVVAELHLAGLSNRQIAAKQACIARTIDRKMKLIRSHWQTMASDSLRSLLDRRNAPVRQ